MKKWLFPLFLIILIPLYSETIVSPVVTEINIPVESEIEKSTKVRLEESVSLNITGNKEFLKSIDIELHQSNILKKFADSFVVYIYKGLNPAPRKGLKNYSGIKIFSHIVPYRNRIYIKIPLKSKETGNLKASLQSSYLVKQAVSAADFPLLFTIEPIMKGIPDTAFVKYFSLLITPEVENRGFFVLNVKKPEGFKKEQYSVYIDGERTDSVGKPILLTAGIHELLIKSNYFENVNSAFTVEAGKTNTMNILLKQNISTITFDAPENAVIYFDGTKLTPNQLQNLHVKEGDHLIRMKIADYSLTRKITVNKNKRYQISLVFDILVKEY
ncbi:MAG: hypothetical protein DRP57_10925 [Spirochaetes bacterium]|nr:MAG: hypothetical protein DRP57_10925 [Spirochaetota bacterium]